MSESTGKKLVLALFAIVLILVCSWWMNRGYGTVSQQTYEFSKAIYGACLAKSEQRLDKIEQLMDDPSNAELPSHERTWLDAIISNARAGNWESAAKKARSMMEDQAQASPKI